MLQRVEIFENAVKILGCQTVAKTDFILLYKIKCYALPFIQGGEAFCIE